MDEGLTASDLGIHIEEGASESNSSGIPFGELTNKEEAIPVLSTYSEVLQVADESLIRVQDALSKLEGAELVSSVARNNVTKQADLLLNAAREIVQGRKATISLFGKYVTVESLDEIERLLQGIKEELSYVQEHSGTYEEFAKGGLARFDKYLFDGRNIEQAEQLSMRTLVLENENAGGFFERLGTEKIVEKEDKSDESKQDRGVSVGVLSDEGRGEDGQPLLRSGETLPEVVIIHVPSEEELSHSWGYKQFYLDYYHELKPHERPTVILYTDGFEPHFIEKYKYEGFLYCSTMDELRETYSVAKAVQGAKNKPTFLEPTLLASSQEVLYDNSDLREFEGMTADTYQSLLHLLRIFNQRNTDAQTAQAQSSRELNALFRKHFPDMGSSYSEEEQEIDVTGRPEELQIERILDCGVGEGRISGMLARLGYNVIGLDISQRQLDGIEPRIIQEGEGLRGEKEHPGLSYHALQRLIEEDVVKKEAVLDDEQTMNNIAPVKGSFFHLQNTLGWLATNWQSQFPDRHPVQFFGADFLNAIQLRDEYYSGDFGMDAVLFNWHTFCELGSVDNQKRVLRQILNVLLKPGGLLVMEIPDRMVGPYATSLNAYHATHPDEPLGTIRDTTSTDPGVSSSIDDEGDAPRYFPDRNELVVLLQSLGFEIQPERDVQTYLITSEDKDTHTKHLQAKELFITAQKAMVSVDRAD